MAAQSLSLLKRIVLTNKLVAEPDLDKVLAEVPVVEKAIQRLVERQLLDGKTAHQVMALYQKQLQKALEAKDSGVHERKEMATATAAVPSAPKAGKQPSADEAFDEVFGTVAPGDSALAKAPAAPAAAPSAAKPASAPAAFAPVAASAKTDSPAPRPSGDAAVVLRLLKMARDMNASDVHIKSGAVPLVRVASTLREMDAPALSPDVCENALLALLSEVQREHFNKTNDLDFCYDGGAQLGRFRTNFFRQFRGTDGIFRLISAKVPSFEELKLPEQVRKFTQFRQGIVLITGPKGCGKTTTMAAMVNLINTSRQEHIITIEDPIEFVHPCKMGHVNQREVGPHTKSFSNALRAALRKAPDVILVGEMRDLETTSLAITAAETGHLVFATLHTPDAIRTIGRVLDVFPAREQGQIRAMVSESLRGVVSQLLIPSPDGKSMEMAIEILVNTSAIGNLIREDRTFQLRSMMQTGKKLGMQLMDESLVQLVKSGRIAKEEAFCAARTRTIWPQSWGRTRPE